MQDRGTIKWVSLMLPEHVEMIKQLWAEDDYKEKPILSEQQLEENEVILQEALNNHLPVEIEYFKNHDSCFVEGKVAIKNDHLIIDNVEVNLSDIFKIKML